MALNSFDRNYGASSNAREFFFGDNGWFTVVLDLATIGAELGETAVADDASDAFVTAKSAAEYNQFKIAELIGQRAVIAATSDIRVTTEATAFVGDNVLNTVAIGAGSSVGNVAISFLIERADVFTADNAKYGRVGASNPIAYAVNPLTELVSAITSDEGFFKDSTGAKVVAVDGEVAILAAFAPITKS